MELELKIFELKIEFPTNNLILKLIYHFYHVKTYMCYQFAGNKLIQNFE
jgi:hypothetical protein